MGTGRLVIRGGTVVDGTGAESREADVAIEDGQIVEVGQVTRRGEEELDARGLLVTPGFVDIHTHYDGQATWSSRIAPSSSHGVTTAIMGNCGVGFAPCRPDERDMLVRLMEGVEDIPGVVLEEGLPWNWESFSDYLDALAKRRFDIDLGTQVPHAALRIYVIGQSERRARAGHGGGCRGDGPAGRRGHTRRCARLLDLAHARPSQQRRHADTDAQCL